MRELVPARDLNVIAEPITPVQFSADGSRSSQVLALAGDESGRGRGRGSNGDRYIRDRIHNVSPEHRLAPFHLSGQSCFSPTGLSATRALGNEKRIRVRQCVPLPEASVKLVQCGSSKGT